MERWQEVQRIAESVRVETKLNVAQRPVSAANKSGNVAQRPVSAANKSENVSLEASELVAIGAASRHID